MSCSRPLHVRIESIRSRLMVSFRMVMDSSISWPAADGGPSASGASGRLSMNKNSSTVDRRRWSPPPPPPPPSPGRCRKLYHRSLSDDGDRDAVAAPPCRLCTFRLMVLSSGTATSRWCLLPAMVTVRAGRTVFRCAAIKKKIKNVWIREPDAGRRGPLTVVSRVFFAGRRAADCRARRSASSTIRSPMSGAAVLR